VHSSSQIVTTSIPTPNILTGCMTDLSPNRIRAWKGESIHPQNSFKSICNLFEIYCSQTDRQTHRGKSITSLMNRNQSINQSIIIIYNASLKETLTCECECKFIQCIIVQKPTMHSTVLVISKQLDFNLEQKT